MNSYRLRAFKQRGGRQRERNGDRQRSTSFIATAGCPPNYLHESWLDYLYWDTELDP